MVRADLMSIFLIAFVLMIGVTGCGGNAAPQDSSNPDTPHESVAGGSAESLEQTLLRVDSDLIQAEFTRMEGEWQVTKTDFTDKFLFMENDIITSETVWNEFGDIYNAENFFTDVFDLIAFKENQIYVLAAAPVLEPKHDDSVETPTEYQESWYTLLSEINIADKYINRTIGSTDGDIFGGTQYAFDLQFDNNGGHTFHYVDSGSLAGNIRSSLVRSSAFGASESYSRKIHQTSRIWEIYSSKNIFVTYADTYLVIIYAQDNSYVLGYIKENSIRFNEALRFEFTKTDDSMITGSVPVYASGNEEGIYFQLVALDNGLLDFDGESTLCFYSFETGEYEPVLDLSDKITHINGEGDTLVFDYYSIDSPRNLTGRIASLTDDTIVTIPDITPVNGIRQSVINDSLVYIASINSFAVYDMEAKTFAAYDTRELPGNIISNIKICENEFGFLSREENGALAFYRVRLRD